MLQLSVICSHPAIQWVDMFEDRLLNLMCPLLSSYCHQHAVTLWDNSEETEAGLTMHTAFLIGGQTGSEECRGGPSFLLAWWARVWRSEWLAHPSTIGIIACSQTVEKHHQYVVHSIQQLCIVGYNVYSIRLGMLARLLAHKSYTVKFIHASSPNGSCWKLGDAVTTCRSCCG